MKTNSITATRDTAGKPGKLKVGYMLVALSLALCQMAPLESEAGVSIGVNIGFEVPAYPNMVPVPGYPVYYDPAANSNYFFYDGQYWVFQNDNWYTSSWYNGPWQLIDPDSVPLFILRVPVRFYRRPPPYFHGWVATGAPHWEERWGDDWRARHNGWNHWDRHAAPHPAPLPAYQRQYSGDRYPHVEDQQRAIRTQNYHYQPAPHPPGNADRHEPPHGDDRHDDHHDDHRDDHRDQGHDDHDRH